MKGLRGPRGGPAAAVSVKTELIADRVWRTRTDFELGIVEYLGWFNHDRLHESLGDIPPIEFEDLYTNQMSEHAPANNIN
jgi:putative transposase